MPLEQIRPLLSLDSRSPITAKAPLAEDDLLPSSPHSPRSPSDGDALPHTSIGRSASFASSSGSHGYHSSIVGPTSPTVRSSKSLFSDPHSSYQTYHQWPLQHQHRASLPYLHPSHSQSPERPQSSGSVNSTPMDLQKLGALGGVNRSGSWRIGGVSAIGRGHQSAQQSDRGDDLGSSSADSTVMNLSTIADLPTRSNSFSASQQRYRFDGAQHEGERDPSGSSSRASTTGSHHSTSYSAAAFSLRSVSNRSSTGSTFSHSTAASISPPSGSSGASSHEDGKAVSKPTSQKQSDHLDSEEAITEGPEGDSNYVVGPGVSRVRSIGRGATDTFEEGRQNVDIQESSSETGLSPTRATEASTTDTSVVLPEDSPPQNLQDHEPPPMFLPASAVSPSSNTALSAQPWQVAETRDSPSHDSHTSTPQTVSVELAENDGQSSYHSPRRTVKPSTSISRLAAAARAASPRASPTLGYRKSPMLSCEGESGKSPRSRRADARSTAPLMSPPWTAQASSPFFPSTSALFHGTPAELSASALALPIAPRRHTGGLRTRSALGQQLGSSSRPGSTSTSTASFGGPGHEGGRRAARERARYPTAAKFENAPFSVIEAMRARGIRIAPSPSTSQTSDRASLKSSSPSSSPMPDGVDKGVAAGKSATLRPLSSIAHASPDATEWWPIHVDEAGNPISDFCERDEAHSSSPSRTGCNAIPDRRAAMLPSVIDDHPATYMSTNSMQPATGQQQLVDSSGLPPLHQQFSPPDLKLEPSSICTAGATEVSRVTASSPITVMAGSHTPPLSAAYNKQRQGSPPSSGLAPLRPSLARALSAITTAGSSANISGGAFSGGSAGVSPHPSTAGTHVLRTPTTEEWARYLASQGVDPSRPAIGPRTRTATSRSGTALGGDRQRGMDRLAMSTVALDEYAGASPRLGPSMYSDGRAGPSGSSFYGLRPARSRSGSVRIPTGDSHSSVTAADSLSSLVDALSEDGDAEADDWRGSVRSRSSSGSSDSSQGRMEALHAAISMPPSRRGTPPPSMQSSNPPLPFGSSPSYTYSHRDLLSQIDDSRISCDLRTVPEGSWPHEQPIVQDPSLGQRVRETHGYISAPPGHKRTIEDFHIEKDIGRGAYGLVKLVRLLDDTGHPSGPEFVVKYIIKSRILADCWRRHRVLGPIPVEIHIMDQLRRLAYHPPPVPPPWSPEYLWQQPDSRRGSKEPWQSTPRVPLQCLLADEPRTPAHDKDTFLSSPTTPIPVRKLSLTMPPTPTEKNRSVEVSSSSPGSRAQTHPALCTMLDFFEDESFYYLIMPRFGKSTDLFDHIESHPHGLSTREARCILGQVASGLAFLHANNIVHRDIKDENVILDGSGHAQLIDFGSSAHVRNGRLFDTFSGTLDYAAAEILRGDKYGGKEQDVWALGVVAYVCLVGDAPFWNGEEAMIGLEEGSRALVALEERCSSSTSPPSNEQTVAQEDVEGSDGRISSSEGEQEKERESIRRQDDLQGQTDGGGKLLDAMDLIEQCLALDSTDRPTAELITRHVFLAGEGVPGAWRGWRGWEERGVKGGEEAGES